MSRYLIKNHVQITKIPLENFETWSPLLCEPDSELHGLIIAKEYDCDFKGAKLKYCVDEFIRYILILEKVFIHFFKMSANKAKLFHLPVK